MHHRTAWQALAQRPLGFLASPWPWRAFGYLLSGAVFGALTSVVLLVTALAGVAGLLVLVGVVPLLGVALSGVLVARIERWRLRLVDLDPAPDPHRQPQRAGVRAWVETRLREPATWRELGFTAVSLTALWWMDVLVLGFALVVPVLLALSPIGDPGAWPGTVVGLALLPAAPYTITAWAGARAALTRLILAPRDGELGRELREVRASRARIVDAFDAERRRIERDLHDGAQQRLVSVNVMLGMALLDAEPASPVGKRLAEAQGEVTQAVTELRELSRGVHPKALTDHGLAAAVDNLTARSATPRVALDIELPHRLATAVESTAYFVVAEALANVTKHSRADHAAVHARLHADILVLTVTDDGAGGADPAGGSGLVGLADRVAAADGRLRISSPAGGPTLLHVEIPCR
ncbi:sensor histidine kinase [Streptomyces hainanensis]|uniref:histidine kinase n=1 Tax=Streptomyces hainanensis TaxID=402648 RepID=A0A4R4TAL5_9ACTN|nr:sensor domain-containing protein [Streptomyces hainanensis]TDC72182.1 sensor histidine kinase [Streptomyces hainanensis]